MILLVVILWLLLGFSLIMIDFDKSNRVPSVMIHILYLIFGPFVWSFCFFILLISVVKELNN